MAKGSYNSVGAGDTPKLFRGKAPSFVENDVADGGNQGFGHVKVATDIPKAGRPGGATAMPKPAGAAPKVARPGGSQGI